MPYRILIYSWRYYWFAPFLVGKWALTTDRQLRHWHCSPQRSLIAVKKWRRWKCWGCYWRTSGFDQTNKPAKAVKLKNPKFLKEYNGAWGIHKPKKIWCLNSQQCNLIVILYYKLIIVSWHIILIFEKEIKKNPMTFTIFKSVKMQPKFAKFSHVQLNMII